MSTCNFKTNGNFMANNDLMKSNTDDKILDKKLSVS